MKAPGFYHRPPGLLSFILLPFAFLYGAVAAWRMNRPGERAGVPVICIGNLTLGGAGKTPTAIAVARMLAAMGEKPAFVSRGYGGNDRGPALVDAKSHRAEAVGDEPLLLAREFPTVVSRDRTAGARLAAGQGASVLVLDDGFQNPALHKDISIVVIDADAGIGNGEVFPAGPLRVPLDAQMAKAQAVIAVAGPLPAKVANLAALKRIPVFTAQLVPNDTAKSLQGKNLFAFAGIGRPEKFFATLAALGARVSETRSFGDHHVFSASDAEQLLAAAKARGLVLVTTEKDLARMKGDARLEALAAAARALPVRMQFDNEAAVEKLLKEALAKARKWISTSSDPGAAASVQPRE